MPYAMQDGEEEIVWMLVHEIKQGCGMDAATSAEPAVRAENKAHTVYKDMHESIAQLQVEWARTVSERQGSHGSQEARAHGIEESSTQANHKLDEVRDLNLASKAHYED